MINPEDIKAGMVLGQADAQILRDAVSRLNNLEPELLALRKARSEGVAVAAGVYTMLGIAGYSSSETGCAQQKLMSRAGKVIYKAKEDNIDFDGYATWMD